MGQFEDLTDSRFHDTMRWKRAWSQFTRSEECLACFEDHPVVYFKQLVDEEPRAIGRALVAVTILENPIPVDVFDSALQPA